MALNYKCILAYGLTEEELDKIRKRRLKFKEITADNASMRIIDILLKDEKADKRCDKLPQGEKALIFNGYNEKELRETIKFIRRFIEGGVLAVVTEESSKWTFEYLLEHLIDEREWYKNQQNGGN